ncbi:hypothetical protein [Micropruina sp.]|uniref:hypothetical protein n=1 Tax=Micropruina sp. TaxID=2737536 RepID=UPI0039E631E4
MWHLLKRDGVVAARCTVARLMRIQRLEHAQAPVHLDQEPRPDPGQHQPQT